MRYEPNPFDSDGPRRRREESDELPPHSLIAEQGLLGCCLLDPLKGLVAVRNVVGAVADGRRIVEAFYDLRHQTVLQTMLDLDSHGVQVDLISVTQKLIDLGQIDAVGGIAYVSGLMEMCASAENAVYYADVVRDKWRLRLTLRSCVDTMARVKSGAEVDDVVREFQASVLGLSELRDRNRLVSIKEGVRAVMDTAQKAYEHRNQGFVSEIPTGLGFLDKRISGLKATNVFYLGGVQSSGKTSLILSMIRHQAEACRVPVGFCSIESAREEIVLRLLCNASGANYRQIHSGMIAERDFARLKEWAPKLAHSPVCIDDTNGLTPLDLRMTARQMVHQYGIKVLYIDHLHRMRSPESGVDQVDTIRKCVDAVRWCARELKIAVVCAAQLNRESKKEMRGKSRRPEATDFRGASEIEEDADVMGILKPDPQTEDDCQPEEEVWPMDLHIVKQRNGPIGSVKLTFNRAQYRYDDRYLGTGSIAKAKSKQQKQQDAFDDET